MAIEFRCKSCTKWLRVGDETAGRQARCPACGELSQVPSADAPRLSDAWTLEPETNAPAPAPPQAAADSPFAATPPAADPAENPYQSPAAMEPWEGRDPYGHDYLDYALAGRGTRFVGAVLDGLVYLVGMVPGLIVAVTMAEGGGPDTEMAVMALMLGGMLIVGIVYSSGYDRSEKINLPYGQTEEAFGYQFTYLGLASGSQGDQDALKINVQKGKSSFLAKPKFYYSEYNQGTMRTPHIKINLLYDLYLSPLEHSQGEETQRGLFSLGRGETVERNGYTITFVDFEVESHAQTGQISAGAILEVEHNGEKATLVPTQVMGGIEEGQIKRMVHLPGGEDHLVLEKIDADRKMVALRLVLREEQTSEELLVLSVEKKPLINLFWLGTMLVMLGLAIASVRRFKESRADQT